MGEEKSAFMLLMNPRIMATCAPRNTHTKLKNNNNSSRRSSRYERLLSRLFLSGLSCSRLICTSSVCITFSLNSWGDKYYIHYEAFCVSCQEVICTRKCFHKVDSRLYLCVDMSNLRNKSRTIPLTLVKISCQRGLITL